MWDEEKSPEERQAEERQKEREQQYDKDISEARIELALARYRYGLRPAR